MDNSLVELGGAVDNRMIEAAVSICLPENAWQCDVIPVLPDVMGDGLESREASREGYKAWSAMSMPGTSWMLVTQGKDWDDFCQTVNHFLVYNRAGYNRIGWVGIPRKLVELLGSRWEAIEYVHAMAPRVNIHLLGFSENVWDDIKCARHPAVTGIDSAPPVRCEEVFTPQTVLPPRASTNWWEEGTCSQQTIDNIKNVREWVRR